MCMLLLLSHFSPVQLCATPWTAAHQAPLSLGFSRQKHWSGLPFPSPMHESEKWKWSCSVMSDSLWTHGLQPTRLLHPWDFPGKSTGVGCHRLLQYVYIHMYVCCCWVASVVSDSVRPHKTVAHPALPALGVSRQEHWSGLPLPSPMHESEKSKWSHSVVSDS